MPSHLCLICCQRSSPSCSGCPTYIGSQCLIFVSGGVSIAERQTAYCCIDPESRQWVNMASYDEQELTRWISVSHPHQVDTMTFALYSLLGASYDGDAVEEEVQRIDFIIESSAWGDCRILLPFYILGLNLPESCSLCWDVTITVKLRMLMYKCRCRTSHSKVFLQLADQHSIDWELWSCLQILLQLGPCLSWSVSGGHHLCGLWGVFSWSAPTCSQAEAAFENEPRAAHQVVPCWADQDMQVKAKTPPHREVRRSRPDALCLHSPCQAEIHKPQVFQSMQS